MSNRNRTATLLQLCGRTRVSDSFFGHYMELVRNTMLPYQWEALQDRVEGAAPSFCIHNFKVAAGLKTGEFGGYVFQDSDLAKWIEAAAYTLMWHPDAELEKMLDEAIDLVVSAQQPDGYLNTYYIINGLDKWFTNLTDHHELYCAGHFIEAAAAYYYATGKRKLLDAMIRYVDCIGRQIGKEEGKLPGYPGHEVIEMALIKLYEITGDEKHRDLAQYFIDERGQDPLYFEEERKRANRGMHWANGPLKYQYYQAGKPVREQTEAEGHSVRAVYLYSGMADAAAESGDASLKEACLRLWKNLTRKRMYITGAIGSSAYGEAFTFDYDLPNDTVYGESCASVGLVFFANRMMHLDPAGEYGDVMEKALYNTILSGMSMDGTRFFYVNPLEVVPEACRKDKNKSHVKPERQKWFGCACCPPNIARMLTSLPGYIYTEQGLDAYVNLYIGNESTLHLNGREFGIKMESGFPWNGEVTIKISAKESLEGWGRIAFRIPGWCKSYVAKKNGRPIISAQVKKGFLYLNDELMDGDEITLDFAMPAVKMCANPRVREDSGKLAVMRGPLVYCLEEADNGELLANLRLSPSAEITATWREELLGGVMTLQSPGRRMISSWDEDDLYRPYSAENGYEENVTLTWIPYYAWANRGEGEMAVWIRKG
ncbi:MAG: glycoside hydrolase family 127 protein [Lachnospiraceae bacterium]|nr:glycoside hydrolase family 127 protein [Lachnospiraceae bacterium]